jgi:hypothetical protein
MKRVLAGMAVAAAMLVSMVAGATPASAQQGSTPAACLDGILVGAVPGAFGSIGFNGLCGIIGGFGTTSDATSTDTPALLPANALPGTGQAPSLSQLGNLLNIENASPVAPMTEASSNKAFPLWALGAVLAAAAGLFAVGTRRLRMSTSW